MREPVTIAQIMPGQDTDYDALYSEGIRMLQKLSGGTWTDYNEHDPGVTILESLCYLITDLYERTEIPVENLLTEKDGKFPAVENALFTAAEILHNSPLTTNDYSKIIIDAIQGVNNAWVNPYYLTNDYIENSIGISGMYEVLVDLTENGQHKKADIKKEIQMVLNGNRKITEWFPLITFLEPTEIKINFNINVQEAVNAEDLLSDILFKISSYMKPGVNFYTYDELVYRGMSTEEIFEGPALVNGFIPDTALTNKVTTLYVDLLLKHIIGNKGVSSVSELSITVGDKKIKDVFEVPGNSVLVLNVKESLDSIFVFKQNTGYTYNKNLVISQYNELQSKSNRRGKIKFSPAMLDIPIPSGKYVDPERYYSMQNDFPQIYGIGKEKLPEKASGNRKAQALQLKSYLLFYEQLMADFMSQTANLGNIFSSAPQRNTYFFQPLYNVPDGVPLLKGYTGDASMIYESKKSREYTEHLNDLKSDSGNAYISGLKAIYKNTDDYERRRNLFLDHMLARFNFIINPSPVLSSIPGNNDMIGAIPLKEALLANMADITASRGNFNPPDINNESGFNPALGLLLHALSGIPFGTFDQFPHTLNILNPVTHHVGSSLFEQNNNKQVNFNTADPGFLMITIAGLLAKNYTVEKQGGNNVFYLNSRDVKLKLLERESVEGDTTSESVIDEIVKDFLTIYLVYENIYVIEHIQLMPALGEAKFTWKYASDNEKLNQTPGTYSAILDQIDKSSASLGEAIPKKTIPDPVIGVLVDDIAIHQDFYSNRLSVVIPVSSADLDKNPTYENYFHSIVVNSLPAHVCINVFWVDADNYKLFMELYENYVLGVKDAKEKISAFLLLQDPYKQFKL